MFKKTLNYILKYKLPSSSPVKDTALSCLAQKGLIEDDSKERL